MNPQPPTPSAKKSDDSSANLIVLAVVIVSVSIGAYYLYKKHERDNLMRQVCITNLREIATQKANWRLENQKNPAREPTLAELAVYFRNNTFPTCPAGGTLPNRP